VKRLIVNADDFGLTAGVNRAILELHAAGALSSATLMASAAEFRAAALAGPKPRTLGIGCHVVLVDGKPLLPASEIPTLVDPRNPDAFRPTLGRFVADLVRGRIREAEIEAEALAQIRRLRDAGVEVTHLDTHKHTHMFARVLRPLLRAAMQAGVAAIRNPFEPSWSVRATHGAGLVRRLQVNLLSLQRNTFCKLTRQAGLATTGGALGVLATGTLDAPVLRRILGAMPDGTWELVCHPGYCDPALRSVRTRLLEARETERTALEQVLPPGLASHGIALATFADLTTTARAREQVHALL
jgi:predicted glycoside hydrolase/deacetylase ChbG (UPF0249 family)